MSGVVCVVCPITDDEKLKNIHVDLALLVRGPVLLSTHDSTVAAVLAGPPLPLVLAHVIGLVGLLGYRRM